MDSLESKLACPADSQVKARSSCFKNLTCCFKLKNIVDVDDGIQKSSAKAKTQQRKNVLDENVELLSEKTTKSDIGNNIN